MLIFSMSIKMAATFLVCFVLVYEYAGYLGFLQKSNYDPYECKYYMDAGQIGANRKLRHHQVIRVISGISLLLISYGYNLFQYPTDIESYFVAMLFWGFLCIFLPIHSDRSPLRWDAPISRMVAGLLAPFLIIVIYLWNYNSHHLFRMDALLVAITMTSFLFILDYRFLFFMVVAILKKYLKK